jgi:hypothetical protein
MQRFRYSAAALAVWILAPLVAQAGSTAGSPDLPFHEVELLNNGQPRPLTSNDCAIGNGLEAPFPDDVPDFRTECTACRPGGSISCVAWEYEVTGSALDHVSHTVNAGVPLLATSTPTLCAEVGAGDSKTKFLDDDRVQHEFTCRFNANGDTVFQTLVTPASIPVLNTVLLTKGRDEWFAAIDGVGTSPPPLDPNLSQVQASIEQAGPCTVRVLRNPAGQVVKIELDPIPENDVCVPDDPADRSYPNCGCETNRGRLTDFAITGTATDENGQEILVNEAFKAALPGYFSTSGDNTCFNFTTADGQLIQIGKPCPDKNSL